MCALNKVKGMGLIMNKNGLCYRFLRKVYRTFFKRKEEVTKSCLDKEQFYKRLLAYDVISFDIFDTLLTRNLYEPHDLFYLMGEKLADLKFFQKRKEAERRANEILKKDVNLTEIYSAYQELYGEDTKKIQKLEEELEVLLCLPRKEMQEIFYRLKEQGKTVILTSDMYLSKKVIVKMLQKCGYQDYDAFYLSNELDKRKDRKDMWPFLKTKYAKKRIIHVGDNENSDFLFPKEFGIDAIKIESGKSLFSRLNISTHIQEFLQDHNISNSYLLGLLVNQKMFNSPFAQSQISSLEDFGFIFHAPILFEFLSFVVNRTKKADQLLFLAREGYYLQKLYQQYCHIFKVPLKENTYFLASRKATIMANLKTKNDLIALLNNEFKGKISSFFKQVLEMDYIDEDYIIELPKDKEKVAVYLQKYEKQILQASKVAKDNYLLYVKEVLGNYQKKNLAIIDLGYSGTIQYQLTKLMQKEMEGFYVTNSSHVKKYHKTSKLNFLFDIAENDEYQKIYHYSLILEYFLSAPYGQLLHFDQKKGKAVPVYNSEKMSEEKRKSLEILFGSVIDFFEQVELVSNYFSFQPDKNLICRLYTCLIEENLVSKEVKDQFSFTDSFCADQVRNVFKIISRY